VQVTVPADPRAAAEQAIAEALRRERMAPMTTRRCRIGRRRWEMTMKLHEYMVLQGIMYTTEHAGQTKRKHSSAWPYVVAIIACAIAVLSHV
jgi:hypothetical protein